MPIQTRHPIAMAQQALANQAVCNGRFTLGLGPSHHWIVSDMLGLPYDQPARTRAQLPRSVERELFAGPGPVDVENDDFRVHNPTRRHRHHADADPARRARAGDAAASPASCASGTILWMADERAISDHVVPRITNAAANAGRPAPRVVAGVPVTLCSNDEVDAARARANQVLGHAEYSPNYERLLEHGDAQDVGDLCAAGDEAAVTKRLQRFRERGRNRSGRSRVCRSVVIATPRMESFRRTQAFVASLCPEI